MGSHRYIHCAEPAKIYNGPVTTPDIVLHLLGDPKWSEPAGEQDVREWMRARRRIHEKTLQAKTEDLGYIELLPEDHEKLDYMSAHPTKGRGYRIEFLLTRTFDGEDGKKQTKQEISTIDVSADALDHIDAIQFAKDRKPEPAKPAAPSGAQEEG